MNRKIIKRIVIITVVVNIVIFLVVGGYITYQKTKKAITKEMTKNFQIPDFSGKSNHVFCRWTIPVQSNHGHFVTVRSTFSHSKPPVDICDLFYHTLAKKNLRFGR